MRPMGKVNTATMPAAIHCIVVYWSKIPPLWDPTLIPHLRRFRRVLCALAVGTL